MGLKPLSKKLLNLLAKKLDKVPAKQFDYGKWIGDDWKGAKDLSCGTQACALGWATTIPELRDRGLYMAAICEAYSDGSVGLIRGEITCKNQTEFDAGAEAFGITYVQSEYLFAPRDGDPGISAKAVAKKIRKFVRSNGKIPREAQDE